MKGTWCERLKISIDICAAYDGSQIFATITKEDDPNEAIVLVGEDANEVAGIMNDLLTRITED